MSADEKIGKGLTLKLKPSKVKKIYEAEDELDALKKIVVGMLGARNVPIQINDEADTAYTDFIKIVLTHRLIPDNLKDLPIISQRLMDGQAIHETAHFVKSRPISKMLRRSIDLSKNPRLRHVVQNIGEDVRVNSYAQKRFRWDIGARVGDLISVMGKATLNSYNKNIAKQDKLSRIVNNLIMGTLYVPMDEVRKLYGPSGFDKKDIRVIEDSVKELQDLWWREMTPDIMHIYGRVYRRLEKYGKDLDESLIPRPFGSQPIEVDRDTLRDLAEKDANFRKQMEEDALKEKESKGHTASIGSGLGLEMDSPPSNMSEYNRLVNKNIKQIQELLKLLKRTVRPKYIPIEYQRKGRLMGEMVAKAYVSALKGHVRNIYEGLSKELEKHQVAIALVVDLSGSMNTEEAKDALTIIAEVSGRWLKDLNFCILVFGSNFQKVKVFKESYHNTRYRIGGVQCMGGTEMLYPLERVWSLFEDFPHGDTQRILVMVSDFATSQPEECQKQMDWMRKKGIVTIGVPMCSYDVPHAEKFCGKSIAPINAISELPRQFFNIYRRVVQW